MKKTVQIVLVLLLLTCTYRYAWISETVSFLLEPEKENSAGEMDEETEKEIISKMKVTAGGVMEITEISRQMTKEGETRETRNLKYPYFTGGKSREINSQIYEWFQDKNMTNLWYMSDQEMEYEITYISDRFLSILFEGYQDGTPHYGYDYGMNFDLKTGKLLSLEDFYEWPKWKVLMEEAMEQDQLRVQLLKENVELEGEESRHYLQNYFINLFGMESNLGRENVSFFIKDGYLFFIMYPDWKGDTFVKWEVPLDMAELEARREPEKVEESDMPGLYQKLVESAQLDWEWVIEPGEYEDFIFLGGKYIAVKKENGKYSIMYENGDFVFSEEYDSISPFNEHIACAQNDGKYFYFFDAGNGCWLEGDFQNARNFYENRAAVQMNGKWGFLDRWSDGEIVIECQYEEVNDFQEYCAAVKKGNGWGFIDMYGTMIVPCQYDEVKDYSDGLAAVKKDGKWGYIDKEGQVAIELMYDDAGSFSEGKAPVERNDYYQDGLEAWAYIDSENTVVIDWFPCYGGAAFRKYVGEFHDGFAFVLRDIPTIINENGEEVFDSYFFINDYVYDSKYKAIPAYVFTDDLMTEKKYGLVGVDGNCLLEPIFDWIWEPCGDYVRVEMIVEGEWCEGAIRIKEKE